MGFGDLIVKLALDSTLFNRGMSEAVRTAKTSADKMATLHDAGGRLLQLAGIGGLGAGLHQAIQYASKINDLSERIGVSTTALQEMDYAAALTGSSVENLVSAMQHLAKARKAALQDPKSDEAESFRRLGVEIDRLKTARLEDLLYEISNAFKDATDNQELLADGLKVLGRAAGDIFPSLKMGLEDAAKAAHEAGVISDPKTIRALDEYGDQFTTFGKKATAALSYVASRAYMVHNNLADGLDTLKEWAAFAGKAITPGGASVGEAWRDMKYETDSISRRSRNRESKAFEIDFDNKTAGKPSEETMRANRLESEALVRALEKEEKLRVALLTPEERRNELLEKRQHLEQMGRFSVNGLSNAQREQIADLNLQIQGIQLEKVKGADLGTITANKGDELTSIGNFLGGAGSSETTSELRSLGKKLDKIDRTIRAQEGLGLQ